jgi:hypothetical protein
MQDQGEAQKRQIWDLLKDLVVQRDYECNRRIMVW